MGWFGRFLGSTLGLKYVMAVTGLALVGFLASHLLGNLLVFAGEDALNAYAQGLKDLGALLWVARGGMIVLFAAHVVCAFKLTAKNKSARPTPYQKEGTIQASFASRTMIYSGLFILLYLAYHLSHFTFQIVGVDGPYTDPLGRSDVYTMVVEGFQNPMISIFYLAAMVVMGLHTSHGFSSLFQSLGLNHEKYNPLIRALGPIVGWGLAVGYMTIPLAIWFRIIG